MNKSWFWPLENTIKINNLDNYINIHESLDIILPENTAHNQKMLWDIICVEHEAGITHHDGEKSPETTILITILLSKPHALYTRSLPLHRHSTNNFICRSPRSTTHNPFLYLSGEVMLIQIGWKMLKRWNLIFFQIFFYNVNNKKNI